MKSRIVELDGLRGLAALFVLIFHFSLMSGIKNRFLFSGVTGVDLFFLISGFVIIMTLSKIKTAYEFIISRVLRLFPTYLVMLSITLLVIFYFDRNGMPGLRIILGNLSMMQPLLFIKYIDDSYWTLTVEMQFYVLMLILYLGSYIGQIELAGSIILISIISYYLISYFFFENSLIYIFPRYAFPLISHFQLFLAGILFYNIWKEGASRFRYFLLLVCGLFTLFLFDKSGRAHFFIGFWTYSAMIGLYFTLFSLFVLGKLKFLRARIMLFLGNISYGLYLLHQEAGKVLYNYILSHNLMNYKQALILLFIVTVLVATIVTICIEKPVRNVKKYLISAIQSRFKPFANDGTIS